MTTPKLYYLVRPPKIKSEKNPPLLLLLHGVGGNEHNLFDRAEKLPGHFLVVSARAPLTMGPGSYAWFQVNFSTGRPIINERQAEQSRQLLINFIDDLHIEQNFDENQVYLMGFSQGGIMSYSVALTAPEKIKAIAVISGRLLPEIKPLIAPDERLAKLNIYISHGQQDKVLQLQYALDAVEYLKTKHLHPELHTYPDGHTITDPMLADVVKWLEKISIAT